MNNGIMSLTGLPLGRAASSGLPVGATMWLPDSGPRLALGDKSEWIRTGVLYASSLYPKLAALDVAKAHSFGTTSVSAQTFNSMATNGTGTFVGGVGAATTVHRSTDGAASFGSVSVSAALNGVGSETRVAFGAGVFVCVTNNGTSIQIASSADGSAWTNRLNYNTGTYNFPAAFVVWTGTFFYVVVGGSTNGEGIWYSANGTAWTKVTHTFTINTANFIGTGVDARGFFQANGSWFVSTNSGVNWTAVGGMGAPIPVNLGRAGNNFVGFSSAGVPVYTATPETNTSWVAGSVPRGTQTPNIIINPAGTTRAVAILTSGLVHTSEDGLTWNTQYNSRSGVVTAAAWGDTNLLVCIGATGNFRAAGTTLSAPNAVGTTVYTFGNNGSSTYDTALYLRAK